jgi:hypothetical protein
LQPCLASERMMASLRLCTRPAGNQEETGRRNAESRPGVAHPADTCDAGFCQEIPSFQIQWLAHHIISTERENKKDFFYKKRLLHRAGRQAHSEKGQRRGTSTYYQNELLLRPSQLPTLVLSSYRYDTVAWRGLFCPRLVPASF